MPINIVLLLAFLFAAHHEPGFDVADHYSLWLSDTSLAVVTAAGDTVSMDFPAAHPAIAAGRAEFRGVFPDIDLVVYKNAAGFEYDWAVAPFADPSAIELSFRGERSLRIGSDGDLILGVSTGAIRHRRPFAYQHINGMRQAVAARFELADDGRVRFKLGAYDKSRPLVIDPALSFVTGIGGSGATGGMFQPIVYNDFASGMALDGSGNIYVTGLTYSADFPLVNSLPLTPPPQNFYVPCPMSFLAKLTPDGKTILYSTLLTGCSNTPPAIAVDPSGNTYVVGAITGGPFIQTGSGVVTPQDTPAFLAKFDPNGVLKAAIAFGGSVYSAATSVALVPDGSLYVSGNTASPDFPISSGALQTTPSMSSPDIFLMKLVPALLAGNQLPTNAVLYSAILGPATSPLVTADAKANAYVAANTTSTAWVATPGVYQSQCWDASREGCADVIAMKVNPSGNQFLYTTYLGGSEIDTVGGLAVDGSGNAFLTGTTNSFDFPTTPGNMFQGFSAQTAFAVKLNADASQLIYGTLLGEDGGLTGAAIAVDSAGDAWVGGYTNADSLPVTNGIQQTLFNAVCYSYYDPSSSTPDAVGYCPAAGYLLELDPTGTKLPWATYLGNGSVNSIVLDQAGNLFAAGSQIAMTTAAAAPSPNNNATVVKISLAGTSLGNVAVENAAGFQSGLPAPGGLGSLFVDGIPVTGTVVAPELPLPTQLAGITVSVDGIAAPILAVANATYPANTQINFQVPFETATEEPQAHILEVQYAGQSAFIVPQQAGPGIFLLSNGAGVIQHASDYSLVTGQNPVKPGETLIIYSTGLGTVDTPVPTGSPATQADPVSQCYTPTTSLGTVLYAGLTPGFPGLYQVNVQVSPYLPPGVTYFSLATNACWPFFAPQNVANGNAVAVLITN